MRNFYKQLYSDRIKLITERAKQCDNHTSDLDIGESCYLLSLIGAVKLFRMKCMSSEELFHEQKHLESELLKYYQHCELFNSHVSVRNQYSHVLTEAEKHGCPICQRLVKIFEGREN